MRTHYRMLVIGFLAVGTLAGVVLLVALLFLAWAAGSPRLVETRSFLKFGALISLLITASSVVAVILMRLRHPWAYRAAWMASIILIGSFFTAPVGAFAIWVLRKPQVKAYLCDPDTDDGVLDDPVDRLSTKGLRMPDGLPRQSEFEAVLNKKERPPHSR